MARVLVVQDQTTSSGVVTEMLEKLQHNSVDVQSLPEALSLLAGNVFDMVIIDAEDCQSAVHSLTALKNADQGQVTPIVVAASLARSEDVIEAMRLGAIDHLNKPISSEELSAVIERALARPRRDDSSAKDLPVTGEFLVGLSPVMRSLAKLIGIAAACDATVLVQGETGTGKDTVARTIHRHSLHNKQSLTVVDCTAVPEDYESFESLTPGAQGTVILDEIGDLNGQMQAMLVRALRAAKDEPPARAAEESVRPPRIIATTQYDLINMVKEKRFREDLYYRLNVLPIMLPPLRERGSDVLALAETFLQQARPKDQLRLSSSAAKSLLDYQWPGNVRELQNLMYHLSVVVRSTVIEASDLPFSTRLQNQDAVADADGNGSDVLDYHGAMAALEKRLLKRALKEAQGSRAEAARILGINRQLLYAKLKTYGLMASFE